MDPFPLPVTAWAAALLGFLHVALTMQVVFARRMGKVALGTGGNREIEMKIRAQGNAAEQIPLGLILLALAELLTASWTVVLQAVLLVSGRYIHGTLFNRINRPALVRPFGMVPTLAAHLMGSITIIVTLVGGG
ncbi:MAG: MAPEG family protein [Pseudomonadota bacterium]